MIDENFDMVLQEGCEKHVNESGEVTRTLKQLPPTPPNIKKPIMKSQFYKDDKLKQNRYRLVHYKNNFNNSEYYLIEKRKKFLFWEWWSDNYLPDCHMSESNYNSTKLEEIQRQLKILNGEMEREEKKVIE